MVIVYNENSYKGQKEIKTVFGGHSVCNEFGRNFLNAFLHQEKSMQSGDVDDRERRQKVKVVCRGEGTCVSQSSGISIFLPKLQGASFKFIRFLEFSNNLEASLSYPKGDMNSFWAKMML